MCSLACHWRLQSALRADQESFLLSPARILDGRARLYISELSYRYFDPTPPSILTLVTWVPQSRLAYGHSAHKLAKPNPTVCCLDCRWRLQSALWADQESFSIDSCRILQLLVVLQLLLSYTTIYPLVTWVPQGRLGFDHSAEKADLLPNQILQCAVSLADGSFDRPCGPIKSHFLMSLARILDGRA